MTHFPIALLLFSALCDFASVLFGRFAFATGLRRVSLFGLAVSAAGSIVAVVSGIALTKGNMWGSGELGWHHRFIWPAFGLLILLAVWRVIVRDQMSRTGFFLYLFLMFLTSGLVAAAGYFGGELVLGGG
jgi:uncharacterized membrane protein